MAVLEQLTDLALDPLLAPGGLPRGLRAGAPPSQLRGTGRQLLAHPGYGREDRLDHLAQDVERADLMRHLAEDRGDWLGVQCRAVGRDPFDGQAARLHGLVEAAEECLNVLGGRGPV